MTRGRRKDRFGGAHELPSGRWRARYAVDGRTHQKIFPTRAVAEAWLTWSGRQVGVLRPVRAIHRGVLMDHFYGDDCPGGHGATGLVGVDLEDQLTPQKAAELGFSARDVEVFYDGFRHGWNVGRDGRD